MTTDLDIELNELSRLLLILCGNLPFFSFNAFNEAGVAAANQTNPPISFSCQALRLAISFNGLYRSSVGSGCHK
jgi:hypothetical protein